MANNEQGPVELITAAGLIRYRVVRSARRKKTIQLRLDPEQGVTVTAPVRASRAEIEGLVQARSGWIVERLGTLASDSAAVAYERFNGALSREHARADRAFVEPEAINGSVTTRARSQSRYRRAPIPPRRKTGSGRCCRSGTWRAPWSTSRSRFPGGRRNWAFLPGFGWPIRSAAGVAVPPPGCCDSTGGSCSRTRNSWITWWCTNSPTCGT